MQNDISPKTTTHLSLCSGYEGIGLGLRRVLPDVREIAYVEIEAFAIANLVNKMEAGKLDAAPVFSDLKEFPFSQFLGGVDILSGGFPCQPFSAAGKREGVNDPRHLWPDILRGITECLPGTVFLENVEGIISSKTGDGTPVLLHVLRQLEDVGYRATAGTFSAAEVGAKHLRKRVFIMGHSERFNGSAQTSRWTNDAETRSTSENVANTESARLEGHGGHSGKQKKPKLRGMRSYLPDAPDSRCFTGSSGQQEFHLCNSTQGHWWLPEPNVGRVVDGCPSRVDRLRLLGNGVVPQTAALAFKTLHNNLTHAH